MNLVRWEPYHELANLRQTVDRLFEDGFTWPYRLSPAFDQGLTLAIDVYESENELGVKVPVPGVRPEELAVSVTDNTLTIKGETKVEEETERENYLRRECRHGAFARSLTLPAGLDTDKVEASLDDGILTLTIPKAEEAKSKVIKVKAKKGTEGKKIETKN